MFINFFQELKQANIPVTLREYLTLIEALNADIPQRKVEDFYYLSRSTLVKDEKNLDKFDRVFGNVFKGLENIEEIETAEIPEEWLQLLNEKYLTEEEKKQIEAMGGWEKLMEELKKRLEEQEKRHEGGSKWIGTAGTSPSSPGSASCRHPAARHEPAPKAELKSRRTVGGVGATVPRRWVAT